MARWLAPYVADAGMVIDLGCGTGLLLDLLRVAPDHYYGIDISEGMLARARQKHPAHRFLAGDIEAPIRGIADGRADLVVSLFGSISYCGLEAARDRVMRLLAPGGRFFLMFCGPRYPTRSTFIDAGGGGLRPEPAARVIAAYAPERAWGMSAVVDWLPGRAPNALFDGVLRLERATIGRVARDLCYFLIVTGRRSSRV
ncbi:MAG TPA: class I SAM-dependent methyltransferase [Gemmatimonadaceae bacterium]|nr:class I SAM-dependent methyltransferase [Gemmatimonadaceae bacterium]